MGVARRFTLIDLLAAVGAAGFGLGWVVWLVPGRSAPALIVSGPLLGILWQRSRGGRGILGGAIGAIVHEFVALIWFAVVGGGSAGLSIWLLPRSPLQMALMTMFCLIFGTSMGLLAWLMAGLLGQSRRPEASSSG